MSTKNHQILDMLKNFLFISIIWCNYLFCPFGITTTGNDKIDWIKTYCAKYGFIEYIALKMCFLESRFIPTCKEFKKFDNGFVSQISWGAFQISKKTLQWYNDNNSNNYSLNDLYDFRINTKVAIWWLSRLHKYYGNDWKMTASAHNVGPNGLITYKKKYNRKYYIPYLRKLRNTNDLFLEWLKKNG